MSNEKNSIIMDKSIENKGLGDLDGPKVFNSISDAMEEENVKKLTKGQNEIILKNAQAGNGGLVKSSKRGFFRVYKSLTFVNKEYTTGGIISTILSLIAIVILCYCVLQSVFLRGIINTNIIYMAIMSFIISTFSFIIGMKSFKEEDKKYLFSRIGLYSALFVLLFWTIIYIRGLFLGM